MRTLRTLKTPGEPGTDVSLAQAKSVESFKSVKSAKSVKRTETGDKKKKKLMWTIHHLAGLYAGILIAILCFTGAMAVFIPEIDFLIQKHYYSASSSSTLSTLSTIPTSSTASALSSSPSDDIKFSRSLAELQKKYPEMSGLTISLPRQPGQVAVFNFKDGKKTFAYFIDAGRDRVEGSRNPLNSVANYLRQMHVRLYEGFWGRQLVGIGGIALLVVTITGFFIYADFMKKQPYPEIRQKKGMRILMGDWHKILGISALAFNFVIAATGAWLGLQPKLEKWFNIENPNDFTPKVIYSPESDAKMAVAWPEVLKSVKREFPELIPVSIVPSDDGSATISITGNIKGLIYERNINTLLLSKTTLKPVFKYDIREKPFSHQFYFVQEGLHFGDFGGLAVKILYTVLGLITSFLSISGFIVYFYRTDKKEKRKLSPLKITFIYILIIILVLTVIALISTLIGYKQAATLAAILVNGILTGYLIYVILQYFLKKYRSKPMAA
ncbi:PepSY-associated TM helix domain-containing protein [Pedobacter metabolipauper]|uniref:Putative iron-regulated membrane protein n=1 Tax=Pedobacter metabolipauper TaxID=425513 RepID=A0A4R6T005_9SPHI|nr:PepSY-associated TM helix domain-containing protein [Pedobacter metabolipauper]TDQ10284.1 putative iron-regulated membrane protein [Pedobacter metabolipauper]